MQKVRFDFRGNKIIYDEEQTCNGWSLETGKWVGSDEDFKNRFCKSKKQTKEPKVVIEKEVVAEKPKINKPNRLICVHYLNDC